MNSQMNKMNKMTIITEFILEIVFFSVFRVINISEIGLDISRQQVENKISVISYC